MHLNPRNKTIHWIVQYKLYHLPFWLVYHYLWWALTIGSAWEAANNILFSDYTFKFLFYVVFQAIGVYFNLYFLIPRLLEKSRYPTYIIALLLTIFGTAAIIASGYFFNAWFSERSFQELWNREPDLATFWYFIKINALPSTAASMTLAMSIKLGKNWLQTKTREQHLEKEKLETELKFLRSQFNPHFLFNTINSIFFLIHKNPDQASEALSKFSDLLRYQLYECNETEIPLRQELAYLENFIELEKLRHDHNDLELDIALNKVLPSDRSIAPFILIPFIENAFKHVSCKPDGQNAIQMSLRCEGENLYFQISNSYQQGGAAGREAMPYQGIGLQNVQRRLNLLYPEEHYLNVTKSTDSYSVDLQLQLHAAVRTAVNPTLKPA